MGQHLDLIPQYAAELVEARFDALISAGEQNILTLQQATKTICNRCARKRYVGVWTGHIAGSARRQYNWR